MIQLLEKKTVKRFGRDGMAANSLPYDWYHGGPYFKNINNLNLALSQSKTNIVSSIYFLMLATMSVLNATLMPESSMMLAD